MGYSPPPSPPTNLSPMDITPGGQNEPQEINDAFMNTYSAQQSPDISPPDSTFSNAPTASTSTSSSGYKSMPPPQTASSVPFPKPSAQFTSHVLPPTPTAPTQPNNAPTTHNNKTSPRLSRPQLTSRLSSRSGGKRHASIGSARELPFPAHPTQTAGQTGTAESGTSSQGPNHTTHTHAASVDNVTPGWNARLREMGLHIPGIGSPRTPKTPKSGSMSSGAATPRSPEEQQRVASYFSFRRRGSNAAVSPGKSRNSAATPPPPPPPPPSSQYHAQEETKRQQQHRDKEKERDTIMPSPIAEETMPPPAAPKRTRANLSLDLSTALASRGSTASLPLIGHTPVEHLVQGEKPRRASMVAPLAPPPHVHTPPVHPPAYEYPFLPNHPPNQPLEVRVEEASPSQGGGDAGSWIISVRLPGFHPDGITVGTRRGRVLMIVADNYSDDDGGHFERRISFGYDADMAAIRAEFNGDMLRVTVPRRWMFGPAMAMMIPRSCTAPGGNTSTRPTVENGRQ